MDIPNGNSLPLLTQGWRPVEVYSRPVEEYLANKIDLCKHTGGPCVKVRHSNPMCSISLKNVYHVICPKRLQPTIRFVFEDAFPEVPWTEIALAKEMDLTDKEKESPRFDFFGYAPGNPDQIVAIEIQAVNVAGNISDTWLAVVKGQALPGPCAMNSGNASSYLARQFLSKAPFCARGGIPFYSLVQDTLLSYVMRHYPFPTCSKEHAEVNFVAVDFEEGSLELKLKRVVRTTLMGFVNSAIQLSAERFDESGGRSNLYSRLEKKSYEQRDPAYMKYLADQWEELHKRNLDYCSCGHTRQNHISGRCIVTEPMICGCVSFGE